MAKNRSSHQPFASAVNEGLDIENTDQKNSDSSTKTSGSEDNSSTEDSVSPEQPMDSQPGVNPYYDYHPKTGKRGGVIGAPRARVKRIQISIGCTEEEKILYKNAAAADGRKLSEFISNAVTEYINNHKLDV